MAKNKKCLRAVLFGLVILAAIFLSAAYGQTKPEPKLLWQRNFEERIENIFISYDGSVILVHTSTKIETEKGNYITKNYLLNENGEVKRVYEERRPSAGWILSGDGEKIFDEYGRVMDSDNNTLKTTGLNLLIDETWSPKFSPSRRYVAKRGKTYIEGLPFIEMYELESGKLLWEYKPETEQPVGFEVEFIDDERLVVYEYDKVRLVDVRNGEKLWETEVFKKSFGEYAAVTWYSELQTNDSGDVAIAKWEGGYVAFVSRDGQVRWEKNLGGGWPKGYTPGICAGVAISPSGRFLSLHAQSPTPFEGENPPIYLYLIDNLNGKIVWRKELSLAPLMMPWIGDFACFLSDEYLLRCTEHLKEKGDVKNSYLHLWDVKTGKLLWKFKTSGAASLSAMQLSGDKKKLLVVSEPVTVYLFDVSEFTGGGK